MSRSFLTHINLNKNEIQNAVAQNLAAAPSSPAKGQFYYNSTGGDDTLYWWNGSQWIAAKAAAGAVPAGTVTTSAVADAGVVGVSTNFAREDHKHGRESFGASTAVTTFGAAKADGTAVTLARSDHTHGSPVHDETAHANIPLYALQNPFNVVQPETVFGGASNNGVSNSAARADHKHGNPVHDGLAHSAVSITSLAIPTADLNMSGYKIISLGTPVSGSDAVNKSYVDNIAAGLTWKAPVRVATTANGTLGSFGSPIDGVAMANGDRVLVKSQTATNENGIYTYNAGALTRATDSDTQAELVNAAVFVSEGTLNADTAWVQTTNAPISVNVTALNWVQFAGGGAVVAGAGLTQIGNQIDVVGDTSIVVAADLVTRGALTGDVTAAQSSNATTIANGAVTNAKMANMPGLTLKGNFGGSPGAPQDVTQTQVKGWLGATAKTTASSTAGVTTTAFHGLNTQALSVTVYRSTAPYDEVICDVEHTDFNNVTVRFAAAVAANEYSIVMIG